MSTHHSKNAINENILSTSDIPVLFIIFNRPESTKRVFEAIRKEKPRKLFVAADGARGNAIGEAQKCDEARRIATAVDWECDIKTLFRDRNLGCGKGPAGAITWFFENVEEGIILEDDCLPSHDFFVFCATLLDRYRHDTRIMEIGGTCFLTQPFDDDRTSYYFSNHNMIWGWATWRRAWKLYDFKMSFYNKLKGSQYLKNSFHSAYERDYFTYIFDTTVATVENVSWWDYQWEFIRRLHSGLVIVPKKNLVINLGLGPEATHTTDPRGAGYNLKLEEMDFPLIHPEFVAPDLKRDSLFFKTIFTTRLSRFKTNVKKVIPNFMIRLRRQLFKP
jgi:hypothetical protein